MKINPKIAKQPEDLTQLAFSKMRSLVKKDLIRLEKNTHAEAPTQIILNADHAYSDGQEQGLIILGAWKGAWKKYAKEDTAKKAPMGAIGQAYFGGETNDGQTIIHIGLAKGKAKSKGDKLAKSLKKLLPPSSFDLRFSEISEEALEALEAQLDSQVDEEPEENFDQQDENQEQAALIEVLKKDFSKIEQGSLRVREQAAAFSKGELSLNIAQQTLQQLHELSQDWLEQYQNSPETIQQTLKAEKEKVQGIFEVSVKTLGQMEAQLQRKTSSAPPRPTGRPEELPPNAPARVIAELGPQMLQSKTFAVNHAGPNGYWCPPDFRERIPPGQPIPANKRNNNNVTWCNYFVWEMSKKLFGANDPFKGKEMSANVMVNFLNNSNDFQKIIPPNRDLSFIWDKYINQGKFVVFGWTNPKGGSGHVALGSPTTAKDIQTNGGWRFGRIVQAGATVGPMFLNQGFGIDLFPNLRYFVFASKEAFDNLSNQNGGQNQNNNNQNTATKLSQTLSRGSKGPEVVLVQELLLKAGYQLPKFGADGDFGNETLQALLQFQNDKNIEANGQVGPDSDTWKALNNLTFGPQNQNTATKLSQTLSRGSKGPEVVLVQELLLKAGYQLPKFGADGDFGNETLQALQQFQNDKNIEANGQVSPDSDTWKALNNLAFGPQNQNNNNTQLKPEQIELVQQSKVKLSAQAEQVLREILAKAQEPKARIFNTFRSEEEQAVVMYRNLENLGIAANRQAYQDKTAAGRVIDAYEQAKNKNWPPDKIAGAILKSLQTVGAAKISAHCQAQNPAIDLDGLQNPSRFEQICRADARLKQLIKDQQGYHLELK